MQTFQLEQASVLAQCTDLFVEHYHEVSDGSMPMQLDVPFYLFLESAGQLMILTCRVDGAIVGYVAVIVRRHPHYVSVLCGFEDGFFLSAKHRKGLLGKQMLEEALKHLKARGVKKVFWHTKLRKPLGLLMRRMGFTQCDELWSKEL